MKVYASNTVERFNTLKGEADDYIEELNTFKTTMEGHVTDAETDLDGLSFATWDDAAQNKFENYVNNSLKKGLTGLGNELTEGGFHTLCDTMGKVSESLGDCATLKQAYKDAYDAYSTCPKEITKEIGTVNPTTTTVTNPNYAVKEKAKNDAWDALVAKVEECNGYLTTIEGLTFSIEEDDGSGGGTDGNTSGDNSGGSSDGDSSNGDSSNGSDSDSPFIDGGLGGMSEEDAYPSGNLRHGNTYNIQYTDTDGNVHDATLTFRYGDTRSPSDKTGWNITVTNPDGSTSKVYPYQIAQDDNGYMINVYKPTAAPDKGSQSSSADVPSSSSAGKPGSTPKTNDAAPEPTPTPEPTATPAPAPTPTPTPTADNSAKKAQIASDMGIRDQVALMDNVHSTGSVTFNYNGEFVYLQPNEYDNNYGLYRGDGSRVDGYSFTHDQVTQNQYDENNNATYPEVEDAVEDYFANLG